MTSNDDVKQDLFTRNPLFFLPFDERIDMTALGDASTDNVPTDESPGTDVVIKGDQMTISGNDKALLEHLKKYGVTPRKVSVQYCG